MGTIHGQVSIFYTTQNIRRFHTTHSQQRPPLGGLFHLLTNTSTSSPTRILAHDKLMVMEQLQLATQGSWQHNNATSTSRSRLPIA